MYSFGGEAPLLTIVVPCYNEEDVLHETSKRLKGVINDLINDKDLSAKSHILFVDDGSKDQTWSIIKQLNDTDPLFEGLKLARNVGHQNALLAGLYAAGDASDCVVSIDADLQDDVNVIREFVAKFHEGYDVVYGVRNERKTDTLFKRTTAQGFYRLMEMMGVKIVYNHADYRLMSHRVVQHLKDFKESNLFLRGIVPLIGYPSTKVFYTRDERFAGESKYPLKKMLAFAWDGITSFSVIPIRFLTYFGFCFIFISLIASLYAIGTKLFGHTVSGWTSLILSIWLIGGIQLVGLGMIGEYIGKIYKETKARPKFIVEEQTFRGTRHEVD